MMSAAWQARTAWSSADDRRAEQRHDPVAHHLAHRAAVLLDGFAHVLEHRIEQLARLFRIAVGDRAPSSP